MYDLLMYYMIYDVIYDIINDMIYHDMIKASYLPTYCHHVAIFSSKAQIREYSNFTSACFFGGGALSKNADTAEGGVVGGM